MKIKLLLLGLIISGISFSAFTQQITEVTSKEVVKMLEKNKDLIVLDVRTPAEFQAGHIKGAINVDITQDGATNQIDLLNPDSKYIVYCRTKNRSRVAANYMIQHSFKTVYQMVDGIVGWNQNELPVVK